MKRFTFILAAALSVLAMQPASAQLNSALRSLGNKASGAVRNEVRKGTQKAVEDAKQSAKDKEIAKAQSQVIEGKTLYVSVSTGSARADGLTPETPMKDLQKAINVAEENDRILVAEGNYLGNMDRGYIESGRFGNASQKEDMGKFISIYGGYSTDFKDRDVMKYITKLQPVDQSFIAPLFNVNARRPYGYVGPVGTIVIDGLVFDLGENNRYCAANPDLEITGTPNSGVLTGRFVEPDASPNCPIVGYSSGDEYGLHLDVEGNVRISNCIFVNCRDFGIAALMGKGHMEICNNIFIACRYAACQVAGTTRPEDIDKVSLEFHHNTVLFTWTRTKAFEDMGQGFRFMNGIRTIDVHNNIFGCNSNCGVERCRYEANKADEAAKKSNLYDNYFFANRRDLEIASSGASSISVPAARIEEVDEKLIGPKYEGNRDLPEGNDAFLNAIDQPYLEGFMNLKIIKSQSYNANSAANQVNRMFGLNQQGTEIVRPSMYCNKYPWEKAKDLFGKVADYGAQMPDNQK